MDVVATIAGVGVLVWMFVGPLVGYSIALRGWRIRWPFTRAHDED